MADLNKLSTKELRAELHKRQKAANDAAAEKFRADHPCPECGGDPVSFESKMVEEFRFAPKDDQGRPMLYMPYEMGTTEGGRWELALTCVNGHVTYEDHIRWFEKPIEGPPVLQRGSA